MAGRFAVGLGHVFRLFRVVWRGGPFGLRAICYYTQTDSSELFLDFCLNLPDFGRPIPEFDPGFNIPEQPEEEDKPQPPLSPVNPCQIGGGRRFGPAHRALDVQTGGKLGLEIPAPERGTVGQGNSSGRRIPPPYNLNRRAPAGATNFISFRGQSGYQIDYFHAHRTIPAGTSVDRGDIIGVTDHSGRQTAFHIHLQVTNPSGNRVNPAEYFKDCQ